MEHPAPELRHPSLYRSVQDVRRLGTSSYRGNRKRAVLCEHMWCVTAARLIAKYRTLTLMYSDAVTRLKSRTGVSTLADYVVAFAYADEIRLQADQVLSDYRLHVAEHGCIPAAPERIRR